MRAPAQRDPISTALRYLERGWQPLPIPDTDRPVKGPRSRGWEAFRCTAQEAPFRFSGPCNVGVLLGAPSGGLLDVDLDCPEALAQVEHFLPPTAAVFGRAGKPRSHRLYLAAGDPGRITKWALSKSHPLRSGGKDSETLLELRSTGGQTVFPGSLHEDTLEPIEWDEEGEPTRVERADLERACGRLAASVVLTRAGWSADAVRSFLDAPGRETLRALEPAIAGPLFDWLKLPRLEAQPSPVPTSSPPRARPLPPGRRPGFDDHYAALGPEGIARLVPELEPRLVGGERRRIEVRCPRHSGENKPDAWVMTEHSPRVECKHRSSCGYGALLSDYLCERDRIDYSLLLARLADLTGLGPWAENARKVRQERLAVVRREVDVLGSSVDTWRWVGFKAQELDLAQPLEEIVPDAYRQDYAQGCNAAREGQRLTQPRTNETQARRVRRAIEQLAVPIGPPPGEDEEGELAGVEVLRVVHHERPQGLGGRYDVELCVRGRTAVVRNLSGQELRTYRQLAARAMDVRLILPAAPKGADRLWLELLEGPLEAAEVVQVPDAAVPAVEAQHVIRRWLAAAHRGESVDDLDRDMVLEDEARPSDGHQPSVRRVLLARVKAVTRAIEREFPQLEREEVFDAAGRSGGVYVRSRRLRCEDARRDVFVFPAPEEVVDDPA